MRFGFRFSKWLICKRHGVWYIIPPLGSFEAFGARFESGTEAFKAFAAGGKR